MPFDPSAWANAQSEFNRDEPPAPGVYTVVLAGGSTITARESGRQSAKLTWKVTEGFAADHVWGSLHTLEPFNKDGEPSAGLGMTKQALRTLGVDVAACKTIEALEDELARIGGTKAIVEVTQSGQWTNTNVKRLVEPPPGPPPSGYGKPPEERGVFDPVRQDLVRDDPPTSDVPGAGEREFVHSPAAPQRGDIDPETGEEIPF